MASEAQSLSRRDLLDVNGTNVWLAGVIGVSYAVAVVTVGWLVVHRHAQSGSIVGSPMTTGVATVQSTAPTAPLTEGPALLPSEEQGLPG
jgi:hypothetical protein